MVQLASAMDKYESAKALANRSEKTLQQYEYVLNGFGEYLGRNPDIEEITAGHVRRYLQHLRDRDLAITTVAIHHRVLRAFFNWLVDEGDLEESPMANVAPPKTPNKFPRILKQEQVDQLLESEKERTDCWAGMRNYALLVVLIDMGLRRSELIEARLENLDLENHTLKVNGKGAKDRQVYFGKKTQRALKKWLHVREDITSEVVTNTIFIGMNGEKLKERNVNRILTRLSKRAGLEDVQVSPHVLRHTSATMAVENGMDGFSLRKQFGWEQMETAQRYVHMSGKRLEKAFERTSPMDNREDDKQKTQERNNRGEWVDKS